jgi:hypothetical protein
VPISNPMTRLTIEDAQNFYLDHGNELLADYKSMINVIRRHQIDTPLGNSNYLHALLLTRLMVDETSRSFRMLTGGSLDGFVTSLNESFRSMLLRIRGNRDRQQQDKPVRILIVNGGPGPCEALNNLKREFSDIMELVLANHSDPKFPHFIVSDGEMVRDEKPHEQLTPESDANIVEADVSFYSLAKAAIFESRFDTFWNAAIARRRD